MRQKTLIFILSITVTLFLKTSAFSLSLECKNSRTTPTAPEKYQKYINNFILPNDIKNGKKLYLISAKPLSCKVCHGIKGDARFNTDYSIGARNFTCENIMKNLSDGQMFYIIKFGSGGEEKKGKMLPYKDKLSDKEIWQIISYIRTEFTKKKNN